MNIQPLSNRPREIRVTEIIEPAYERVKLMLFKPFDLTKWIVIGFCAWLAGLGEAGGGGSYNPGGNFNNSNNNHNSHPADQLREFYQKASDFVLANLVWIIPVAIFVVVIGMVIWLVLLWLSSRGKFMFLHCVALDRAEVEVPWRKFANAAHSLLWFRAGLGLAGMILILPMLILIGVSIVRMVLQGSPDLGGMMVSIGLGLMLIFFSIVCALIQKFLVDFVVPIMYLRGSGCLAAWRELGRLLSAHPGAFVLYILFQIVLKMAIAAIVVTAILITCCIAGCFLLLPFVGTVLMLPILIFKRAYALYFLAQFGPEYDVFPPPPQ